MSGLTPMRLRNHATAAATACAGDLRQRAQGPTSGERAIKASELASVGQGYRPAAADRREDDCVSAGHCGSAHMLERNSKKTVTVPEENAESDRRSRRRGLSRR